MAFKDNGDGTVTDTKTRLMWQKQDNGQKDTFDASVHYCQTLSLAEHRDWRLPTVAELTSIVLRGRMPCIDVHLFTLTQPERYWTRTAAPGDPSIAYTVDFGRNGDDTAFSKYDKYYVRAVRRPISISP